MMISSLQNSETDSSPTVAAPSPSAGKPFRPRAPKPRVRTGCIVCKIRRVKCDEHKPACLRCTTTGRKCDGYAEPSTARKKGRQSSGVDSSRTSASSPLFPVPGDSRERRSLQYFRCRTVNDISRYFESDFWDYIVLQVAHTQPTVRHALLAISSIYEAHEFHDQNPDHLVSDLTEPRNQFAFQQYTKAVRLLSNDLSTDRLPVQVTLISCLLFVWLEFLRNDFENGLKHLKSGLQILQSLQEQNIPGTMQNSLIDEYLPHIFTRMLIQGTLHGCPTSDFNSSKLKCPSSTTTFMPSSFRTLSEARHCLDTQLSPIFQFIRQKQEFEAAQGADACFTTEWPVLMATRDSHLSRLQKWHSAFQNSANLSLQSCGERASAGIRLLQLNYAKVTLMMKNLFITTEMVYDQYNPQFEHLLSLAEEVVRCTPPSPGRPALSFDMGVISPLFYIVLKCRDLGIRRRGIALLKLAPAREGMWHRETIVQAVSWKVAVEERARYGLPETSALPESARIYNEKISGPYVEGEPARVRFKGGSAGRIGDAGFEDEIRGLLSRLGDMM